MDTSKFSGDRLRIISWDEINGKYGSYNITQLIIGSDSNPARGDYLITNIHSWGVCLCYQGSCNIMIDGRRYRIRSGDMYIVFRNRQLSITNKSSDYKGYVIAADVRFLAEINPNTLPRLVMRIRKNPCASLSPNQQRMIASVYNMLLSAKNESHIYTNQVLESLFKMLYYEIAGIYREHLDGGIKLETNRKEMISKDFSELVLHYSGKMREVSFYAEKLNVSTRYLTECVRSVSGYTPARWIAVAVIHKAKTLLDNGNYSIQQVSDMMNFPNPSFFTQYFKRHTGITPKRYRQNR